MWRIQFWGWGSFPTLSPEQAFLSQVGCGAAFIVCLVPLHAWAAPSPLLCLIGLFCLATAPHCFYYNSVCLLTMLIGKSPLSYSFLRLWLSSFHISSLSMTESPPWPQLLRDTPLGLSDQAPGYCKFSYSLGPSSLEMAMAFCCCKSLSFFAVSCLASGCLHHLCNHFPFGKSVYVLSGFLIKWWLIRWKGMRANLWVARLAGLSSPFPFI